jgi:hypothetical protein
VYRKRDHIVVVIHEEGLGVGGEFVHDDEGACRV